MIEKRMIYLVARLYVFLTATLSRASTLAKTLMPIEWKKSWDAFILKLVYSAARMWVRFRRRSISYMMHGFMRPARRAFAMALVLMMVVGLLPGTLFVPAAQAAASTDGFIAVSSGDTHTLGVKSDGTLWAWGFSNVGALGLGSITSTSVPMQVGSDTDWKDVSAGYLYSLALKANGTLYAWGYNNSGQLGLGDNTTRNLPTKVGVDQDWVYVSASGNRHSLGLKSNGNLYAWGDNNVGQLGLYDKIARNVPTRVTAIMDRVVSVSAGGFHSLAVDSSGRLWAWGGNYYGTLGIGEATTELLYPVQVGSDQNWASVSAGDDHSMALRTDGSLYSWGRNYGGALGFGNPHVDQNVYYPSFVMDNVSSVSAGSYYTMAVRTDRSLWGWGDNYDGCIGAPDRGNLTPVYVTDNVVAVSAGKYSGSGSHTMLIKSDGSLWGMGRNGTGELGDGTTVGRNTPTLIYPAPIISIQTQPASLTNVVQGSISGSLSISASVTHGLDLNYQWYTNVANNNTAGTLIYDETNPTFKIPTNLTATGSPYYYFCEVTVVGQTEVLRSDVARVNVNAPTYSVSFSGLSGSSAHTFVAQTVGYSPVIAVPVTVNNTGNQATGALTVALSGANANSFTLSATSLASIAAGGSRSFTVVPINGLSAGTYTATVTVSGSSNISASFGVSFMVNKADQTLSAADLIRTVGDGSINLSGQTTSTAGAQSGAITYTVLSPGTTGASISGTTLSYTSAGTATITASAAGSANYNSASTTFTLTVNPPSADTPKVLVSDGMGRVGHPVTLQVMAENSPPLTMFNFRLDYPEDVLRLTGIQEPSGAIYQIIKPPSVDDYYSGMRLTFNAGTSSFDVSGVAVNLAFEILGNASAGEYEVSLSDINASEGLTYDSMSGTVTVIDYVYGDFDDNGLANGEDATWILRYEAADYSANRMVQWWPTSIGTFSPIAGDFTNDGRTDGEDATWILRYEAADYSANRMVQWWPSAIDFSHLGVGQPILFTAASPLQDTLYTMDSDESAAITGTHESGEAGGAPVTIQVVAENSPQLTMFNFKLSYPEDVLKLTGIQLPDGASFGVVIPPSPDFYYSGMRPTFNAGTSSFDVNGVVLNLTFEILGNASAGVYDIEFTDINASDGVVFSSTNGSITVVSQQPCVHEWDGGVVTTPATCIAEGVMTFTCSICGDTSTEIIPIDPDNHTGDTYDVVQVEATCAAPGLRNIYCDDCDALLRTEAIAIDPIHHTGITYEDVITEATCTVIGVVGTFCDGCDELLSSAEIGIDPDNHVNNTYEEVITWATCISTGEISHYCCDCDALLSTEVIPVDPSQHTHGTYTKTLASATCIAEGVLGIYCVDCDVLLDSDVIPYDPNNHVGGTYFETITPATHTAEGLMGEYCESCGALLDTFAIPIPACGHEWDDGVVTTPATCETEGVMTFTCILDGCDEQKAVAIPATGHDWVADDVVAPTCVAEGYTNYTCAVCGDTKQDDIVPIDPDAHDFDVTEYDWGKEYTCKRCGYAYQELYPEPGNETAETLSRLAPSILKNGLSTDNLPLNGKVLRLVIERVDLILSANANNRNIEGEVALGDGYFLAFDIKGNGSNVKIFDVIDRNPPTQAYEASSFYEDAEETFAPVAARLPVSEVALVPVEDGSIDEIAAPDDDVCNPDEDDDDEQADDPRKSEDWLLPDDNGDITPAPDGNEPDADGDAPYASDEVVDGAMEDDI